MLRHCFVAASLSLLCTLEAVAAPPLEIPPAGPPAPPPKPSTIHNPVWILTPNGDAFARFYPDRAQRMSVSGQAVLHCVVAAEGTLSCYVASEDPPDQSFGAAALKLSKLFKMGPVTRDGAPTASGEINIPIRFRVPGAP